MGANDIVKRINLLALLNLCIDVVTIILSIYQWLVINPLGLGMLRLINRILVFEILLRTDCVWERQKCQNIFLLLNEFELENIVCLLVEVAAGFPVNI